MKTEFIEQSILFASILKWFLLATVVGLLVGASTTLFLQALNWSYFFLKDWPMYFLLLPLGLFVSALMIHYLAPDAEGHGTEKVIEAVHERFGKINPLVIPVKLVATVITLASGGSAGKEGPCAQIGAGLSSLFADLFRFSPTDRRKLVTCGVSAGFAAVFGTPIAGALFGVEVLSIGQLQYQVLFPSFVSGVMGFQIAQYLGSRYFNAPLHFVYHFNEIQFLEVILAGLLFGLCSFTFIEVLKYVESLSKRIKIWMPLKGLIGGCLILLTVFVSQRYLGLGLNTIESLIQGDMSANWYDPILKMLATAVTLSFGGSGGILTPVFFVGSTFGALLGELFHMSPSAFAVLGMVGLLSGCANTPISASIMAIELFGPEIGVYAAIVCIISFISTGHRSVYPSQVLRMKKSDSLDVQVGETIQKLANIRFVRKE